MIKKHLLALIFLSTSIFLAYSNSLNGTWALDDIVTGKPVSLADIKDFIGFRKVAYITFHLNQLIAPFSPLNFRLMNILIHIMNTALVYVIAYRTTSLCLPLGRGELKGGENLAFYAALFSGILFGLHPININAVAYIVQRMASLATLFVLLALLSYIAATEATARRKAFLLYAISAFFVVAGIFSKENAVTAIPLILLYDYVFLSHCTWSLFRKRLFLICGIGALSVGISFALLKMHGAFFDVVNFIFNPNEPLTRKGWMAIDVYWTPLQHILTEFRVVSRYLLLVIMPLPGLLIFDWWSFPVSRGITDPISTLPSMFLILSLLIVGVWKWKRFPFLCFGILWYLCAISLESFFALGSDLYFEHRNYLPVSGLFIGIAGQMAVSLPMRINNKMVFSVVIVIGMLLGMLTFSRNLVWKDSLTLWGDTLTKAPSNIRAMLALGNSYLQLSDMDTAEKYFKDAVRISSREQKIQYLDDSIYSLGLLYLFIGKIQETRELIERYEHNIESYRPKILKAFYKALTNDVDGALTGYRDVLPKTKGRDTVIVHSLMGDAYRRKGLSTEAIDQYRQALSRDPGFSSAYYGMGLAYMNIRDVEHAYEYFRKALDIDPDNVLALSDMADVLLIRKANPEEALRYARRAVSKSPPFYQPYLSLGNVLIVLQKDKEAAEFYKKALEREVAAYMVPFSKARAYYLRGDTEKAKEQVSELRKFKDLPEQIKNLIAQE
jgi:tetratricopeptide (TPR) repeat protein